MTRDEAVSVLGPVLQAAPLRLAVLFGSGARDALRADSDLDVGFLPRDPAIALAAELSLQAALERAAGRTVDLVRLDRASTLLRWRAAREGVLLVADSPREFPRFVARAGIEHGDFAPLYARTAERFRRRLAAGGSGPR
ncbi:MAG TPA: nucleotidyltransferase domain-containing protein [Polyangiaceae bacterium]